MLILYHNVWTTKVSYKKFITASGFATYANIGDAVSLLNSNGAAYHTLIVYDKKFSSIKCN
ncbi:hypothetical protein G9F71_024950 [Clostridium sp. FP2]|uniref:hypothetical protein n=1 Tax=Clostridium TaxID=1485 RepID=UPI001C6E5C30|nr:MULTISPECIES: hypothetical protein [Clostridium]MBW9158995.1 hypothetical protein [Clostridium tagluense]MBZ9626057.1 hypothetical protein [Clostridium sp. FP2]WLC68385.1 hypothetical protein KTC93_24935 [Clostridium tagluense]